MKLSIIIPVYNAEKHIDNCINSLLNQNEVDYEIIIIDDGSTDNSRFILNNYQEKYNAIKVISTENKGVSNARNIGISNAHGKYIAFIDSDDRIDGNMYSDMIKKLEKNNVDLVMCSYIAEYDNYSVEAVFDWEDTVIFEDEIYDKLMYRMIFSRDNDGNKINTIGGSVWRCIFKKELIEKYNIKFNTNLRLGEDLIFSLNYIDKCSSIYTTNKCYYHYNRSMEMGPSSTQKYIHNLDENIRLLNNEILMILNDRSISYKEEFEYKKIQDCMILLANNLRLINSNYFIILKQIKELFKYNDYDNNKLNILIRKTKELKQKTKLLLVRYKQYSLLILGSRIVNIIKNINLYMLKKG